jgi:hypothetical protein
MVEFVITIAVGSVIGGLVLGGWIAAGLLKPHDHHHHHRTH